MTLDSTKLKKLEGKFFKLEADLATIQDTYVSRNGKAFARMVTATKRLDEFQPTIVEKAHVKFTKQLATIGGDFQVRILQQTVWTEVGRYALGQGPEPAFKVLVGLIRALDFPWQWWISKKNYTLYQWAELMANQPTLDLVNYEKLIKDIQTKEGMN